MARKKYNVLKIEPELDREILSRLESLLPEGSRIFTQGINGYFLRYKIGGKGLTEVGVRNLSSKILDELPLRLIKQTEHSEETEDSSTEILASSGIKFYNYL